jgi:Coenzyme PQQ synthesis protein D (PqqD)
MTVSLETTQAHITLRINALLKMAERIRRTHGTDGGIILDINHGQMFTLNIVGSKILEMLERGVTEPQIVEEISCFFQIRQDIIERDVREFLDCLEKNRLVEFRAKDSSM